MYFSSFEQISELDDCLLVFDDSCEEIFNDKLFSKLETSGRHKKISVNYVKHNLFKQSKWSRTIDLNTTHIVLFKSPRYVQQIALIGQQHTIFKRMLRINNKATFWSFVN